MTRLFVQLPQSPPPAPAYHKFNSLVQEGLVDDWSMLIHLFFFFHMLSLTCVRVPSSMLRVKAVPVKFRALEFSMCFVLSEISCFELKTWASHLLLCTQVLPVLGTSTEASLKLSAGVTLFLLLCIPWSLIFQNKWPHVSKVSFHYQKVHFLIILIFLKLKKNIKVTKPKTVFGI